MAHPALNRIKATKDKAGKEYGKFIISKLGDHFKICVIKGEMEPFALEVTTNVDDYTTRKALEYCAEWTEKHGNEMTEDYVWFDTGKSDIIQKLHKLIRYGVNSGVADGLLLRFMPQALIPRLIIQAVYNYAFPKDVKTKDAEAEAKETKRMIMFAPSDLHKYLSVPLRVFTVVGGTVQTAVTNVAGLGASVATAVAATVTNVAGRGVEAVKSFFNLK